MVRNIGTRLRRRRAGGHGIEIMAGLSIETGGCSDVGNVREHNEDAWSVFTAGGGSARLICVVADGMGGHLAGEVASARAIEMVEQELGSGVAGVTSDPAEALRATLERANRSIWDESRGDPTKNGMGTTIVCAIVDPSSNGRFAARAWLANVGDSPAFLVAANGARQVTRDHSWVAEQVAAGEVTPEDADHHPYRNILTRCLGTEATVQVDVYEPIDLAADEALVLCSDGLTEYAGAEEIGRIVAESATSDAAARALVDLANRRGGRDNTTVVVARTRR